VTAKNPAARPASATWIDDMTFSAASTASIATAGRGAAARRNRPVTRATAITTQSAPSAGAGSMSTTPSNPIPRATAALRFATASASSIRTPAPPATASPAGGGNR
jgi:hypothetical protein